MSIIRKQAFFNSSTDENEIRTLIWEDDSVEKKAVVQIAHGMTEHIGMYDDFARFLASNGYVVCGNDFLGHGLSVNSEDDYGYFADYDGDRRIVDDMHILQHIMKKRYPALPYFLFGHSMGSLCARVYAMHFGNEINAAVFCGTLNIPKLSVALLPAIDKLVERFGPHAEVDRILSTLYKVQDFLTKDERAAVSLLSNYLPPKNVNYVDGLITGFPFKLGGYRDLYALTCEACGQGWAECIRTDLPIMIISGALDPVSSNGRTALKAADELAIAGHDIEPILYPGKKHQILSEDNKEVVYDDVLKFFNNSLKVSEVVS